MKHTERFDMIINATIACIVIALVLLCGDRLLNGPRQVKKQRDYIEHCLSYYINPYADGWGITIPLDEAEELINNAVVAMMIQNGNSDVAIKLTHLAVLGKCIDEAAELLECSRLEVMQLIRQRLMMLNPFMVNPMFDDETLKRNHMYRKKETVTRQFEKETADYRPVKNDKNEARGQYGSHTPTFGDAFSSLLELKEKLEK